MATFCELATVAQQVAVAAAEAAEQEFAKATEKRDAASKELLESEATNGKNSVASTIALAAYRAAYDEWDKAGEKRGKLRRAAWAACDRKSMAELADIEAQISKLKEDPVRNKENIAELERVYATKRWKLRYLLDD
jgi:hypothetical protein